MSETFNLTMIAIGLVLCVLIIIGHKGAKP
jgi:hypothetical protein